jgi:hypothetical protein
MGKSKAAELGEQAASALAGAASGVAGKASDSAADVAGKVSGTAGDIASKVQDATPDALHDTAGDLGEAAGRRRRPLALILVVAALATVALRYLRGRR